MVTLGGLSQKMVSLWHLLLLLCCFCLVNNNNNNNKCEAKFTVEAALGAGGEEKVCTSPSYVYVRAGF